ncbi:radical SAM family heme chaperone HemW [Flavihumibacter rivuli]|uniref:radical SAM family heme chaperone HemW n=1 Tax=Flavihumibacter rivuli TaxID=2838156 RepID=UPI001BDEDB2B|nr:radical SAM family heme chaperone HemW [Flavihumibacter rivuli]ULQ56308.1 radical SAM family heme chaperone HemW [Flavihumibacter rivuli]
MAGIYIHIPFCRKACHYCNFHFSTLLQNKNAVVQALLKEIEWQKEQLPGQSIHTVYFGGGTPSLLEARELDSILNTLHRHYAIAPDTEFTLEANPDDIDAEHLHNWSVMGINRLSLGVQSFRDQDLQWMNRAHNAGQALRSVELALSSGFSNLTIDLIYGTPGLSDEAWEANVNRAFELGVPHLSCYALTVEPRTALEQMIRKEQMADTDPEQQARQFLQLMDWTAAAGYEHYEISNFARPGWRSRHNSSYWQGIPYLGFGPGAHSFDGKRRRWNVANNALYVRSIEQGTIPFEEEELTPVNRFNEYVMTALRTLEGIDLEKLSRDFGEEALAHTLHEIKKHEDKGLIVSTERSIRLTREGKLYADGIAADLFRE